LNIVKGDIMMKQLIFLCVVFISLLYSAFPASNVTVSPDIMMADTGTWLTVTADVASGSDIEIFMVPDYNGDGIKNGPDFVFQYYKLKEGVAPAIPGSPKPGDEDGLNGHLQTSIDFWGDLIVAGKYVIIVKDSGAEASDTVMINQPANGQSVSGTLVDESGTSIPGVIMAVDVDENEWLTITNLDGTYTISLPAGMFTVGGIVFGYISDFGADSGQMVSLDPDDALTNVQLKVYNGDYTVSGSVSRASGPGVPYLMLWGEIKGESHLDLATNVMTDADGDFHIPVKAGFWEIGLDDAVLNQRGLSGKSWAEIQVSDDVVDFDFVFDDANTCISGLVTKKSDGTAVLGCNVAAQTDEDVRTSCFTRGPDGSFALLVKGGNWMVKVDEDYIFQNGYIPPQAIQVSPSSGSPATDVNFELEKPSSFIEAEVKESGSNNPVSDVYVWLSDDNWNNMGSQSTDAQGKALFGVSPGSYNVGLSSEDIFDRNYIMPQNQDVTVATSETVKVVFNLVAATASIEGIVSHNSSPVPGVRMNLMSGDIMWIGNLDTSETGYYKFPINPGACYIQPEGRQLIEMGIAPVPLQEVIAVAGVNTVNFNLSSPNCTINIHVMGEGTPLNEIQTFVQPITEPFFSLANITTNSSGLAAYPITNGTYDVGMFIDNIDEVGFVPQMSQRVTVNSSQTLDVYYHLHSYSSGTAVDALLNIFDIDDAERDQLDKNNDGRLDVADVISLILDD
jgi:hypothetical protein